MILILHLVICVLKGLNYKKKTFIMSKMNHHNAYKTTNILKEGFFFYYHGLFFFFYQNGVCLKKITNLGKLCLIGTTSYAEVVSIRHDFCHVILKSCQLGTTSAMSY